MFNPQPRVSSTEIAPNQRAIIVDDALLDPDAWVGLAERNHAEFRQPRSNAFPGPELRLPDAVASLFAEFFSLHARNALGARRVERVHARYSIATRRPAQLEPRQWIAHRDRLDPRPGRMTSACVLYLFRDENLGGTAFFEPRCDVRGLVHESGQLPRDVFTARYGIQPGYMTADNAWFRKTASISPRYNRAIFYNGGSVFHTSDITAPEKLIDHAGRGRLTINAFFVCRAALA